MNKKIKKGKSKKEDLVQDLENKLVRALADYDNLRKRVERERDKFLQYANKGLIAKFLTIYDMLESAQEHVNDSGLAIILEEFKKLLQEEQVEHIEVKKGDEFDEELQEAVEIVEGNDKNSGKIAEVLLTGWRFIDGPIIRPVKVKVYRKETRDKK